VTKSNDQCDARNGHSKFPTAGKPVAARRDPESGRILFTHCNGRGDVAKWCILAIAALASPRVEITSARERGVIERKPSKPGRVSPVTTPDVETALTT
jgi:hypothetical protein